MFNCNWYYVKDIIQSYPTKACDLLTLYEKINLSNWHGQFLNIPLSLDGSVGTSAHSAYCSVRKKHYSHSGYKCFVLIPAGHYSVKRYIHISAPYFTQGTYCITSIFCTCICPASIQQVLAVTFC